METVSSTLLLEVYCSARILPTRNGNLIYRTHHKAQQESTDPTYKEWKQFEVGRGKIWGIDARILPTRNGNTANPDMHYAVG